MNPVITQLPDDGADGDLGRAWSVTSGPLSGPLGICTELQGTIGERLNVWGALEAFWWEAWHDVRVMGEECHAEGYEATLEDALARIGQLWALSPLAQAEPYVPTRPTSFLDRMRGAR